MAAIFVLAGAGVAWAAEPPAGPAKAATSPPSPVKEVKPVAFVRLVVRLPVGTPYAVYQAGFLCNTTKTQTWNGGQVDWNTPNFKEAFRTEFEAAGLKLEGDPNNLFETQTSSADYAIAGVVTVLDEHLCFPHGSVGADSEKQRGSVAMTIDWQLYSRLQKQVLATVRTSGSYQVTTEQPGGASVTVTKAFAENVRQLAGSPEIRTILAGAPRAESQLVVATPQPPIVLAGAAAAGVRNVDGAVSSVVLIRTGGGEGSGVLVSRDGYILTAGHVVGDATTVKVRWSDGTESLGDVVRVARGRDVALIKTESRGRAPLGLRRDAPQVGDTVFAIGALYGQTFQSSVTRGVVSAERVFDGYAYLQSDVTVAPGASGGPLLDAQGRVVALTVKGLAPHGAPAGVNLFVPASDAIQFLSLELR